MSITAFPVLARMLTEHRMMGTRVGALAPASAAVDDVLAWCLLALVAAGAGAFSEWSKNLSAYGHLLESGSRKDPVQQEPLHAGA